VTREQRALQIWSVLAFAATNRQVLTYDIVSRLTGVARQGVGEFLGPIQQYCTNMKLPPLTSIVVSMKNGLPGEGFIAAENVPAAQMKVFQHKWTETKVPSAEQLAQAFKAPKKK